MCETKEIQGPTRERSWRNDLFSVMKRNLLARLRGMQSKAAITSGGTSRGRHHDSRRQERDRFSENQPKAFDRRPLLRQEAQFRGTTLRVAARTTAVSNAAPNRILIADDDPLVRGSLGAVLESEGYVVTEARDGIEAVKRAVEQVPALVLLDLNMPDWDGWTAFGQLDRVAGLVPVIVITARPNQYEKAVKLGVDAFMEKPLNIPILIRAIKRFTSEAEQDHFRRITDTAFVTECLGSADI